MDFNARKTQLALIDRPKNTGAIGVKIDGLYVISIAKTASNEIGTLICSMRFLSPEVAVYLYKSTIHPCIEYRCCVWAGAPGCYLELLGKLQKPIYRTGGPSIAASFEPLGHYRLNWLVFLFLEVGLLFILID